MNVPNAIISGNEPTVISTFAGCGGSSLGYKWAGFRELLAIDFDDNSVKTFNLNFPETPVWKRDITQITSKEILDFCNIKIGELDVFDGSPPCQGFSMAGQRKVNDNRNDLFLHFTQLVNELQPKVFLMENVPGMTKGIMKGRYIEIMKSLKSMNYNVKSAILNSQYYEVPQMRERLIFIGIRKDLNKEPSFPKSQSKPKSVNDIFPAHLLMNAGQFDRLWSKTDKPAYTITKSAGLKFKLSDGTERRASIEEVKILCSFPADFKLIGGFSTQWARLGNAVMPKFMYHIAKHIREVILEK